jgi:hypothetical protein
LTRDIQAGPKVLVTSNSNILFQAGREIRLVNGFTAEIGSDFLAKIDPNCGRMMSEIGPVIETINWNQYLEESNYKSPLIVLDSTINLTVYPDPTSNDLFIQSELGIKAVQVFDLTGKSISYEYFSESKLVKIEASTLLNGIYILQITLENGIVEIRKVIKN